MKRLFLTLFVLCSLYVLAQNTEFPQYEFKSTSIHQYTNTQRQYTIPVAAYDLQQSGASRPRRVKMDDYSGENPGYPAADPNWTPVGDAVGPLLLLSLIYFLKKHKNVCILK